MNKRIELLAPAGDYERALFALEYGADAIYLGGKQFSLRARASNFELEDIKKLVEYAHSKNKKVYIVTNVICHNYLLKSFDVFFEKLCKINVDGFIVADPFIFYQVKNQYPHIELHISTQQSITNSKACLFWKRNGAKRVVLAREMKFDEMKLLTEKINKEIEIEVFIHGAVCISYSGRCMMSNNFSLRDANVGGCAQSCRWEYKIENNDISNYFTMSAKDMVYLKHLNNLCQLNIDSFKIEGRMKTINYLTTVVKTYRQAIDEISEYGKIKNINVLSKQLDDVANRQTDDAFLIDANQDKMLYHDEKRELIQDFIFIIDKKIDNMTYAITSKNYFDINTKIKIVTPVQDIKIKIDYILDTDKNHIDVVRTPMTKCIIKLKEPVDLNTFCLGKIDYE